MNYSDTRWLRIIGFFKLLKAVALIGAGIAALKLIHADVGTVLERWVLKFGLDPGSSVLNHAIQRACEIPQDRIWLLGAVSFFYAGLFLVEGTGLWLARRWGEWVTVVITGSLIPVEIYECFHHGTAIKVIVLLLNIAVVIYLIHRIRHEPRSTHRKSSSMQIGATGAGPASDTA